MKTLNFSKMQALGNDFVVLDGRHTGLGLTPAIIREIADRRFGVGCDQLIVIEISRKADVFMRIYNPDGTESGACGNATRCVADIVMRELLKDNMTIETVSGILHCSRADKTSITVDMGAARLEWSEIPLARECDTLHLDITAGPFSDPVAVSMGNPHAVFFTTDVESHRIEDFGPGLEHNPLFPARANIEFVEIINRGEVRMRVWERGAGVTLACGSGACATAVAAIRRDLTDRKVNVVMDGGALAVEWREADGHVLMTGGYEYVFAGQYFLK